MRVLGVDPGTRVTGYGVIETGGGNGTPGIGRLIECGVFRFGRNNSLPHRLAELHHEIAQLIQRHHPAVLALEDAFYHKNVRTTLVLGHARGVILLAAQQQGLDIAQYPPATVKKTVVGAGGAQKSQVAAMVARLLRLKHAPKPADAADGVAVALTFILRSPSHRSPAPERRGGQGVRTGVRT
ncbi:MAG TPA: crossover junction endodeoxyribonuclease RuvC [Gemmatimonadales bacterium]|nr:crossover junction endodeoxyribonuclease RuvC [Gemmatimonadales bacterium]